MLAWWLAITRGARTPVWDIAAICTIPGYDRKGVLLVEAKAHSEDMLGRGFFSHTTPEGWDPGDRLTMLGASGFSGWGENIAAGQTTAAAVMTDWIGSPGHFANMVNTNWTHIGIGVAEGPPHQWTQVFLRRP